MASSTVRHCQENPRPAASARTGQLAFTGTTRQAPSARVVLHVDHVVPLATGGATTEDNLLTACDECNLGKATRAVLPVKGRVARAGDLRRRVRAARGRRPTERDQDARGEHEVVVRVQGERALGDRLRPGTLTRDSTLRLPVNGSVP
jgi:hypothetical protein